MEVSEAMKLTTNNTERDKTMKTSAKIAIRNEAEEICGCILEDCPIDGNLLTKLLWIRDNGMGRGTDGEIDASELDAIIAKVEETIAI